jgi:hypothetical protein
MARVIFLSIVFYLLYRLVFELIIPVYKTTRTVRRQFNGMQDEAQKKSEASRQSQAGAASQQKPKNRVGEYIDFEEIRN